MALSFGTVISLCLVLVIRQRNAPLLLPALRLCCLVCAAGGRHCHLLRRSCGNHCECSWGACVGWRPF